MLDNWLLHRNNYRCYKSCWKLKWNLTCVEVELLSQSHRSKMMMPFAKMSHLIDNHHERTYFFSNRHYEITKPRMNRFEHRVWCSTKIAANREKKMEFIFASLKGLRRFVFHVRRKSMKTTTEIRTSLFFGDMASDIMQYCCFGLIVSASLFTIFIKTLSFD